MKKYKRVVPFNRDNEMELVEFGNGRIGGMAWKSTKVCMVQTSTGPVEAEEGDFIAEAEDGSLEVFQVNK